MSTARDLISDEAKQAAANVGANDTDVVLFNAAVNRKSQERLLKLLGSRERRTNVLVVLLTEGGDPHAAYKISRLFQQKYTKFTCFLPGYSKSAATIILMGAHELALLDDGEMGPVDVQLSKKDALLEYESGLTVLSALTALHEKAYLAWEHFFLEMEKRGGGSITLKTAAGVASELTTGLFSPIYQQIDPLQVGEAVRAMSIGNEYGKRLNRVGRNLRSGALESLVSEYPDHGFVIDRAEAQTLFYRVREATADESMLSEELGVLCDVQFGRKQTLIDFLNEPVPTQTTEDDGGSGDAGTRNGQEPGQPTEPVALARTSVPSNGQ